MIHAHQPVENHMVLSEYCAPASESTGICHFCKHEYYTDEMREFHDGLACCDCTVNCPGCQDWLCDLPEVIVGNERWHTVCAKDAGIEDEHAREAAYGDYIDSLIDEWQETGERPACRPYRRSA